MNPASVRSIGILRLGALGDVCLTVPLIRALCRHLPHIELHWIISRPFFSLVRGLANVNFIVLDKPKSLSDYWRCYQQLKSCPLDVLLVPQATLRSNILCFLTKAKIKYGYEKLHSRDLQYYFVNRTVAARPEHLVESFLRFAEPFGVTDKNIEWGLPIEEKDYEWAKAQLNSYDGRWLAICPATSKEERNWFSDRYATVVNYLTKKRWDFNVVLVGGPSAVEKQMAEEINRQLIKPALNLVGKSSLKQLAALLSEVDVLLSPDTGPLHIAQAVGTPVMGLYAVAPPEKTGPYFSQRLVINKFPQAVKTILRKDPSKITWHERVHSREAMALISVDEVRDQLEKLFVELQFVPSL
ncbi:glycosyltransferase family 9 protein [Candidatus Coxiella mudrowiae]|uniref:ADP-heptose--LPS heptosyltransferase n=1 Tax=Candidatus Coxiella mudrowiae TaxID=2054173 RepID=A0ABN4HU95_9COXI|nr:glycosyltransferase family 9 protein [Candidatus Coxiella mudrowiae]AKQ34011.1 ADP-heptose--LPS heptosyltransferase [Candidatus Coxiella mudrowiae]